VVPIGIQVAEVLERHRGMKRSAAMTEARDLLDSVGIPDPGRRLKGYPHQLSGGMRQRALIAMALACRPRLLIADEPTTALDVTIQAQILALLKSLVVEHGTALIVITHDLGVVAGLCDEVNVLYAGRVVERADRHGLFAAPRHPYTHGLLASIPRLDAGPGSG
jgi:peptide/nickel transport system ATP-binding protein